MLKWLLTGWIAIWLLVPGHASAKEFNSLRDVFIDYLADNAISCDTAGVAKVNITTRKRQSIKFIGPYNRLVSGWIHPFASTA